MFFRKVAQTALIATLVSGVTLAQDYDTPRPEKLAPYNERPITDDVMYFVLPDRFENGDPLNDTAGIEGDRLAHGFDPTDTGFFHSDRRTHHGTPTQTITQFTPQHA